MDGKIPPKLGWRRDGKSLLLLVFFFVLETFFFIEDLYLYTSISFFYTILGGPFLSKSQICEEWDPVKEPMVIDFLILGVWARHTICHSPDWRHLFIERPQPDALPSKKSWTSSN